MNANGFIIALKSEGLDFNTLTVEGKLLKLIHSTDIGGKMVEAYECNCRQLFGRRTIAT